MFNLNIVHESLPFRDSFAFPQLQISVFTGRNQTHHLTTHDFRLRQYCKSIRDATHGRNRQSLLEAASPSGGSKTRKPPS